MGAPRDTMSTGTAAPAVHRGRAMLRVLGTSVSLIEPIRRRCEDDLGIDVEFIVEDGKNAQRIAALHPETFDIYDQWFHNIDLVWPARSMQPVRLDRIERWDEVNDLPKLGRIDAGAAPAPGGNPAQRLYVQPNGELASLPTDEISMLPTVHNADSFAVAADDPQAERPDAARSWASLLAPRFEGRVSVQSDAAIGLVDLILAARAAGWAEFADPGNLTLEEIDYLLGRLVHLRRRGHFAEFWTTEAEASALLGARRVSVSSMWWQGAIALRRRGIAVRMADPAEGFRGWYGGLALSRALNGRQRDVAYAYLNWWLDGYAGAMMTRNNAHISNPGRARAHLRSAEWDYWYAGLPAREDLRCAQGRVIVRRGDRYPGGSYTDRMRRIAMWNVVMDEHNYLVRRWNKLLNPKG